MTKENSYANALSKLARNNDAELFKTVRVELLTNQSVRQKKEQSLCIRGETPWIQEIISCLREATLLENRNETRKLCINLAIYVLKDGILFIRWYTIPFLRCVGNEEATYVIRKIHEPYVEIMSTYISQRKRH